MKNHIREIIKENIEIVRCSILVIVVFMGMLSEIIGGFGFLPVIKAENVEGLMNTLFSAQASIATLGIALLALLSGSLKTKIYGVSISKFVMYLKPRILRHGRIIIIQLLLIFFSYMLLALKYYNVLLSVFINSILLTIFMVLDVIPSLDGSEKIKNEIEQYCLDAFKNRKGFNEKDVYSNLHSDIEIALQTQNSIVLSNDLEFIKKISLDTINMKSDNMLKEFEDTLAL